MKITNIKPINRKALVAQFNIELSGIIVECSLMKGNSGYWIGYPSRQYEKDGQTKSWALVRWDSKEKAEKAKEWMLAELAKLDPSLFQSESSLKSHNDYLDDNLPF